MADVATLAIAAVGWGLALFFGLSTWRGRNLTKSFFDAYVRIQRPIDFGGGRSAIMRKTRLGTYAVEWTQQLGGTITMTGDLEVHKVPARKEDGEG